MNLLELIKNFKLLKGNLKMPLYKNSLFIMLTAFLNAAFGFIFWIIAAQLYPKEDLGISVAIVSAMSLISLLSLLGFDQSIIRFLPEGRKKEKVMTSISLVILSAAIISTIFLLNIDILSPQITIIKDNAISFIVLVILAPIFTLFTTALISLRRGGHYFLQYLLTGSRILLLFPFVIFGALGIFYSVGVGYLLSLILSTIVLMKLEIIGKPTVNMKYLKNSFKFSGVNYITGLLTSSPNLILPIFVLNILGASTTANYYIAFTIASLLFLIPSSFSISLFVEGSHGESLKKNTLHSLMAVFLLLIPIVLLLFFFGEFLLGLFGKSYVEGLDLLKIMALSSFFVCIYQIFFSIKKVQKDINVLILLSAINFVLILLLTYIFMIMFGLIGIGYAWLLSYFIISMIILILIKKENWI